VIFGEWGSILRARLQTIIVQKFSTCGSSCISPELWLHQWIEALSMLGEEVVDLKVKGAKISIPHDFFLLPEFQRLAVHIEAFAIAATALPADWRPWREQVY
jgi:hypothetical protein